MKIRDPFILAQQELSLYILFYCRSLYGWYIYHLFTTFVTCLQPLVNTRSIITVYGLYHWCPLPMFTCQYFLSRPLYHRAINCFVYTCMWLICSLDVQFGAVLPLKRQLPAEGKTPAVRNYNVCCYNLWWSEMRKWQTKQWDCFPLAGFDFQYRLLF